MKYDFKELLLAKSGYDSAHYFSILHRLLIFFHEKSDSLCIAILFEKNNIVLLKEIPLATAIKSL